MELPLHFQAVGLFLGGVFGLGLGLIYDLIRPIRRSAGSLGWLFDAFYAVCAGLALFLLSMCMPLGRPGVWEIMAAVLGFGAWLRFLSPLLLPLFTAAFSFLLLPFKKMCGFMQKVLIFIFQKVK